MTSDPESQGGIIQFAKAPVAGRVKTRMQPVLSAEQCVALHRALCLHTVSCCHTGQWHYRLCVTESEHPFWSECSGRDLQVVPCWSQVPGDLGQRMAAAFAQAGEQGWQWTLVIGSDCPGLDANLLSQARDALTHADLVLVPALDGGYALIGMRRPLAVFEGVEWGSDKVLSQTLRLAERQGLNVHVLPAVSDIDRPEDLSQLAAWPALEAFAR